MGNHIKNVIANIKKSFFNMFIFWNTPEYKQRWKKAENISRCIMVSILALCLLGQIFIFAADDPTVTVSAEELVNGLVNTMVSIFRYVGTVIITWGIIQFLLAVKKSDAESKSEAVTTVVVGIALYSLGTIITNMGIGIDSIDDNIFGNSPTDSTTTPPALNE